MRLVPFFLVLLSLFWGAPSIAQVEQESLRDLVEVLREKKFSESTIAEANDFLPLVRANEDSQLLVDFLFLLSGYHLGLGDYGSAMELCVEAATIARRIGDAQRIAEIELRIGNIHLRAGNYERSISTFRALVEENKALGDTLEASKIEINIALNYYSRDYLDSAISQLLLTREAVIKYGEPRDLLEIDQNLGAIYAQKGMPEEGLPYTRQSLTTILSEQDTLRFAPAYGNMAYTLQELGDFDQALVYYDSSLYYSHLLEQDAITYVTLKDMSEGYQMVGDFENALKCFQEYHKVQASVLGENTLNRIAELEVEQESERKQLALEASEQKVLSLEQEALLGEQRFLMIVIGLIASLLFASLIFLQWIKDARYRKTQKKLIAAELANERLTSGQLSTRLENQQEDLTDFALDIERKNRFSKELSDRLHALKKVLPDRFHHQFDELIHFNEEHDKMNEHLEVVQDNIDQVNHEFHQKLREAFPKLTSSDLTLAGMLRLNMTNKEVATNKGISTASAKMARYRLRKKLGLESTDNINAFLRGL